MCMHPPYVHVCNNYFSLIPKVYLYSAFSPFISTAEMVRVCLPANCEGSNIWSKGPTCVWHYGSDKSNVLHICFRFMPYDT